ncbi:hypothetical protein TREMEDRAFT_66093 [Tremella mesenterica DSM 1558]|uniref:uncharacterized protein n=1 Tax=Tremella mesenterica (strain ATCC 24925 / CBS 8224 / DSM 1558 / NBRC 9311 / NRRL Y-6157 / RJB 2259-6 / UBC 559-6) TaxID=578456 RepID=UPI00032D1DCB|nr:uncharacterized protein TREMEDRAFT_66093 [Tremella mesenterica DSM 1558]EIW65999.1 hypothetical protein TREMEDRAFT_66093 [Tremella mesenterica DSM 1558]
MSTLTLHPTPPILPLPASDPQSIYLISLLQISKHPWVLSSTTLSTPHLKQGHRPVSLDALVVNLTGSRHSWSDSEGSAERYNDNNDHVNRSSLDDFLTKEQWAEGLIWKVYIDERLTDLINHTLYSLSPNYSNLVYPAQTRSLPFPETYYAPQRVRSIHKARLQHVGLWGLGGGGDEDGDDISRVKLDEEFVGGGAKLNEEYVRGPGGTVAPRVWGWGMGKGKRKKIWEEEEVCHFIGFDFSPLFFSFTYNPSLTSEGSKSNDIEGWA